MGTRRKARNRPICKSLIAYPTKGDVVRALQNLHKKGRPINYRAIVKSNPVLKSASRIHFGRWNNALTAAGFDPDEIMKRPKWTKKSLIGAIRDLDNLDIPLNTTSVSKVRGGLPEACVKQFGSWDNALLAGVLGVLSSCHNWLFHFMVFLDSWWVIVMNLVMFVWAILIWIAARLCYFGCLHIRWGPEAAAAAWRRRCGVKVQSEVIASKLSYDVQKIGL